LPKATTFNSSSLACWALAEHLKGLPKPLEASDPVESDGTNINAYLDQLEADPEHAKDLDPV
jgi:hypothetical protein